MTVFLRVSRYPLVCLLLIVPGSVSAQHPFDSLVKKFAVYRTQHLQEKIFMHTDRSLYLTGETLWFKLYYMDGTLHQPLEISKIAYVEILDKEKKAVVQTKVALNAGSGNGSVFLPASLASGNYYVRAYTRWMRNFSTDFYFQELITVINPFTRLAAKPQQESSFYDAQFFPEGGNWINGFESKIAFRVSDAQGKGIACTGVVLNSKNDTVAHFHPLKFGIGNFLLTPVAGQTYKAIIRDKKNHVLTFPMPVARDEGYTIKVVDTLSAKIKIAVKSKGKSTSSNDSFVYLLVHSRNVITVAARYVLQPGTAGTTILLDKTMLGEGISHLTLFNSDMLPVCERLFFRRPESKLKITAPLEQSQYTTRKKVSLDLLTQASDGKPVASNLSVAVFQLDSLQPAVEPQEIGSYLWLSSDLRGNIESPKYYFGSAGDTVEKAADNLMLTQGWSRFTWEEIMKPLGSTYEFIPEYRGHIIRGRVTDEAGAPGRGIITYLSSPGRTVRLYPSRADKDGNVQFELKEFYGSRKIILQTNIQFDSTYTVTVANPFSESPFSLLLPEFHIAEGQRNQISQRSVHMQVQNNFNEERNIRYVIPAVDSSGFYGKPDEHYLLDDYTRFPTMEEVLREYVPGVVVRKRKGKFRFMTLDVPGKNIFRDNPLVLLDGVPVFDIDKIMRFDPRNVRRLEVLTRRYYLGPLSFQGVSSFTTYHGDLSDFEPDFRSLILNYEGLQLQREFFSPKYETQPQRESRVPDTRSLIYWQPTLLTNDDGKQQVDFYTPDVEGKYKIVVQGITKDGIPGSTSFEFEVKGSGNY